MKRILFLSFLISFGAFAQPNQLGRNMSKDKTNEIKVLIDDIVVRVDESEKFTKVFFSTHSGVYYLHKDHKSYSSILSALEKSKSSGKSIKVKTNAEDLKISELVSSSDL